MSNRIPQTFIDTLLSRIDIIEIVNQTVPLKKSGKDYSACCPFHHEKSPSFTVSQPKQFYYCFGCGASGNAIGFLMNKQHLSFMEAVESLATVAGLEVPQEAGHKSAPQPSANFYDLLENVSKIYQNELKRSDRAITYLKNRGLTGEICKTYRVGFVPNGWDLLIKAMPESIDALNQTGMLVSKEDGKYYDRFRDRIMFPIRDKRGRVIAFGGRVLDQGQPKYLNSPETALFHKSSAVYGIYEALQADPKLNTLLVVEGYMDVIALAQHGITHVVATLGTALTQNNVSKLFQLVDTVILCFDGDRAGKSAAVRAIDNILSMIVDSKQIKFMFLPDSEDPDSLIRKEGKENFLKRIAQANSLSSMLIEHLLMDVDISSIDGRAQLADKARPYLNKLESELYKDLLLEELARHIRMDAKAVKKLIIQSVVPEPPRKKRQFSLLDKAIVMLLQQPAFVNWVTTPEMFEALPDKQATLLSKLATCFKVNGHLSMGQLLGLWQDKDEASLLANLAAAPAMLTQEETEEEFKGIISQLLKQVREVAISGLLAKAKKLGLAGLTDDERNQIRDFLTETEKK